MSLEIVQQTHASAFALLRLVRDVMQSSAPAQERLDTLVTKIAHHMHNDVCSIYLRRSGDLMELYATEGLNARAVHNTRLRVGEGLVGEVAMIAAPLNLTDAPTHPKFAYKPETEEDAYHSFVGVPILYSHKVIGILVVQSMDTRIYADEQVETLQTIAMVIAELAIASGMVDWQGLVGEDEISNGSHYESGVKLSAGLARAEAVLHRPRLVIEKLVSDDPEHEQSRLQKAIIELQSSVDSLIQNSGLMNEETQREIMETYRMFTHDRGWLEKINAAILSGLTAEAAVKKVQEQMHARMSNVSSQYIRERMDDLDDLSMRLLYHLSDISPTAAHTDLPGSFILVAKSMGPAELLEYANKPLKGIILEEGSTTSHIAIIAKMMDIPMVARLPNVVSRISRGDIAIVDGDNGEVYIRPPEDVDNAYASHLAERRERDAAYEALSSLPNVTLDEQVVSLNVNIGLYLDAHQLERPDIDGIGLYRTELSYLASSDIPDVDDQRKMYHEVLRQSHGKRVVFRSFDIGGDKQVPYVKVDDEENPAMGWRATRIGLDRPAILRRQFRALIRAAGGYELHVMFPFIAEVSEFDATKALLDREVERAKVEGGKMPTAIKIGSMIEVPSLVLQLPALLERVDFVSIGSNDLLQFLFACDRGSERMAGRYDPLSPVVMKLIRHIVHQCHNANVPLGFCGEMATRPLEAMALLACGVRNLSVPPSSVGGVKTMMRSLDVGELERYVATMLDLPDHSLRNSLERFARDHGVVL